MKTKWMTTLQLLGLLLLAGSIQAQVQTAIPADEVACRIELDRTILPAGQSQTAVIKVTLDPPGRPQSKQRPPINLAIVLDRSGSMSGTKLEKAKEAAIEALRRLGPQDIFSLVIYDTKIDTVIPAQHARDTEPIEAKIRAIQSGGNTALFGGVSQGASEIRKNLSRKYIHRIILLSDGLANVGPNTPEDLGRLGAALLKEEISVTSVGVGNDFNEDLMTQLAQKSDGNHYFVEAGKDLPRIFAAELGDVLSIIARKVVVEIDCPAGIRPLRVIGREGRIRKNTVQVNLNQLYGGQEKYALIEVEVAATPDKQVKKIAEARFTYENAVTLKETVRVAGVSASFSSDPQVVLNSANVKVQSEWVRNDLALTKDKAIDLWDAGQKKAAISALEKGSSKNFHYGQQFKLPPEVLNESLTLQQEALDLQEDGLSKMKRKQYRTESFQTRNQQKTKNVYEDRSAR